MTIAWLKNKKINNQVVHLNKWFIIRKYVVHENVLDGGSMLGYLTCTITKGKTLLKLVSKQSTYSQDSDYNIHKQAWAWTSPCSSHGYPLSVVWLAILLLIVGEFLHIFQLFYSIYLIDLFHVLYNI